MKGQQENRAFMALLVVAAVLSLMVLAPNTPQTTEKIKGLENIGVAIAPTIGPIGSIGGGADTLGLATLDQTVIGMVQSTQPSAQNGVETPGQEMALRKALVAAMATSHKQGIKPAGMRGVALSNAELALVMKAEHGITSALDGRLDLYAFS